MRNMFSVAIDGPSGAGKSSVSKAVCAAVGFRHIDTGAMYRALGYAALDAGVDISDEEAVKSMLGELDINVRFDDEGQKVFVNGEDVTGKIRTEQISAMASGISKLPCVRDFLLGLQRKTAEEYNVVMDGRDIGTVVLPNAQLKVYLTASVEKRAERRYLELLAKNENVEYNKVLENAIIRDKQDMERKTAPLRPAEDAVIVDTTNMTFDESVETITKLIKERM